MRRIPVIAFFIMLSLCLLYGEETVLVGDIFSAETGQPIPNASVYYLGTSIGTASNEEGSFALRADLSKKKTLVVSAVGYRTERFPVEAGTMAGVQIELREQTAVLSEVFAAPGENMALPLIKAVKEHRSTNDRIALQIPTTQKKRTELFISDIQKRHLERKLWGSLQAGMIQTNDSTFLLPLYSSERGAVVMTETDYQSLLTNDGDLNFYDAEISLMGRSFLSPLAKSGAMYYNYYLADSISHTAAKTYIIHYKTKNPFYETLNGELWIDSATFAIKKVLAEVPRQSSVNYLRGARIYQQFNSNHALDFESIDITLDFAVKIDDSKTFPTVLIHHQIGESVSLNSDTAIPSEITDLHANPIYDSVVQAAMDSLSNLPLIRTAQWVATIINTGYVPTGTCVDIGNINEILQVNPHETVHLGLPLRTNERLWKNVSLEAGVGYGFKDQSWKGYGKINVLIPAARRQLLSAEYRDQYVWLEQSDNFTQLMRENSIGFRLMDFGAHFLETMPYKMKQNLPSTAIRKRQFQIMAESDWTDNLETQLYLRVGNQGFGYQTIGGIARLSWHERKIDMYMRRVHQYSHYPVLYIGAELGTFNVPNDITAYHLYGSLNVMLRQHVDLRMAGTLDYTIHAGCILGKVPYSMLYQFAGGRGFGFDAYRFSQMGNLQYAADRYLAIHGEWNGQGILFNLIPGIRYLRLRELVTAKLAWGAHSDSHPTIGNIEIPTSLINNQLSVPYVELGVGIANIFRLIDLVSVWRVTHIHDSSYSNTPYWSMRCRINIGL